LSAGAQNGITKLKRILEAEEEEQFSAEQYMMLYTCARSACARSARAPWERRARPGRLAGPGRTVGDCACGRDRTIYNMCTQKPPHDYSEALYERYKQAFTQYINEKVRPVAVRGSCCVLCAVCAWRCARARRRRRAARGPRCCPRCGITATSFCCGSC